MDEQKLQEIERRMSLGFWEYYDSGDCDKDMTALIAEVRRLQKICPSDEELRKEEFYRTWGGR